MPLSHTCISARNTIFLHCPAQDRTIQAVTCTHVGSTENIHSLPSPHHPCPPHPPTFKIRNTTKTSVVEISCCCVFVLLGFFCLFVFCLTPFLFPWDLALPNPTMWYLGVPTFLGWPSLTGRERGSSPQGRQISFCWNMESDVHGRKLRRGPLFVSCAENNVKYREVVYEWF